jgi:hypothetical protein
MRYTNYFSMTHVVFTCVVCVTYFTCVVCVSQSTIIQLVEPISLDHVDTLGTTKIDTSYQYTTGLTEMYRLFQTETAQNALNYWKDWLECANSRCATCHWHGYVWRSIPYLQDTIYIYRLIQTNGVSERVTTGPHTIQYDSLIVADHSFNQYCGLDPRGLWYYCNFNELFICNVMSLTSTPDYNGYWHGFESGLTEEWHRNTAIESFNVKNWRYLRTRNRNLRIKMRFGKRDSKCSWICREDHCDPDEDWFWPRTGAQGYDKMDMHEYNRPFGLQAITCIAILYTSEVDHPGTCNIQRLAEEGYYFSDDGKQETSTNAVKVIALPAKAIRVVSMENAVVTRSNVDHILSIGDSITSCNAGFTVFTDHSVLVSNYQYPTVRCASFADMACNVRPNQQDQTITSCTEAQIYYRCRGAVSTTAEDECHTTEIKYCTDFRVRTGFEGACSAPSCVSGESYFDIEKWAVGQNINNYCSTCVNVYGKGDPGSAVMSLKCAGAYSGRLDCRNVGSAKYFKEGTTSTQTCTKCIECGSGQYVVVECGSSPVLSGGSQPVLTYVGNNNICRDCTNTCQKGEYRQCNPHPTAYQLMYNQGSCSICTCDRVLPTDPPSYCLINTTKCDGRQNTTSGAENFPYLGVICPIGKYQNTLAYSGDNPFPMQGPHQSMETVYNLVCEQCTPILNCTQGSWWPACPLRTGPPRTHNDECELCPADGHPSDLTFQFMPQGFEQKLYADCSWQCNNGYYKEIGLNSCTHCVYANMVACLPGFYRGPCNTGTIGIPPCIACTTPTDCLWSNSGNRTSPNQYMQMCNGRGYHDITLDDGISSGKSHTTHTCTNCAAGTCDAGYGWLTCPEASRSSPATLYDPGYCQLCRTNVAHASSISNDNSQCTWGCDVGYYKSPQKDQCFECGTIAQHCQCDNGCVGYRLNAFTANMEHAPECFCEAGYERSTAGDKTECTACENYYYRGGALPDSKCLQCPVGYMGNLQRASTTCIPCPINTYRALQGEHNNQFQFQCLPCSGGTDGLLGSSTCTSCEYGSGQMAMLNTWHGSVLNYASVGNNTAQFIDWVGIPPTVCDVQGTNQSVQICRPPGDFTSIRWKPVLDTGYVFDSKQLPVPTWSCELCKNGLAFSSNFDWNGAFNSLRG